MHFLSDFGRESKKDLFLASVRPIRLFMADLS
jgi:hypothetical protein